MHIHISCAGAVFWLFSNLVVFESGPLVLWSLAPLVPWSLGPLVPWSSGPLSRVYLGLVEGLFRVGLGAIYGLCMDHFRAMLSFIYR